MPDHGGNRIYDLWNASPMLCQLSYAVRSVRVCDISKLSLGNFNFRNYSFFDTNGNVILHVIMILWTLTTSPLLLYGTTSLKA